MTKSQIKALLKRIDIVEGDYHKVISHNKFLMKLLNKTGKTALKFIKLAQKFDTENQVLKSKLKGKKI